MFLTESQKHYYTAMKKLGRKKPQKVIKRPQNPYHALFYDISVSRRFEIAIFVLIFLNMVSMGIEHFDQSRAVTFVLEICNALFTTIFSLGKSELEQKTVCSVFMKKIKQKKMQSFVRVLFVVSCAERFSCQKILMR